MYHLDYVEIADKIRAKLGNKIDISAHIKPVSKNQNERYRNADSQEALIMSIFKANWNPDCFIAPSNSSENGYCGDIIVTKGKDGRAIFGIDVKFPSKETKNTEFFSPPDFASIFFLTSQNPPSKVNPKHFPINRIIMTFNRFGEFKFLDPNEVLEALLNGKAELKASYHRSKANYPKDVLDDIASYTGKIKVIDGNGELWPQDFLYFKSQKDLMF